MEKKSVLIVSITFLILILISMVFFNKGFNLTGFAVESSGNLQKLKISSMCSDNPDVFRVWRIWNKNSIDVEFNWSLYETNQSGSGIAIAEGYFYLNTSTESSNILNVFVNSSLHDTKSSEEEQCDIIVSCSENWTCSDWTICDNESQTRVCSDLNNCNSTITIPILMQNCSSFFINETNMTINATINNTVEINITEINQTASVENETSVVSEVSSSSGSSSSSSGGTNYYASSSSSSSGSSSSSSEKETIVPEIIENKTETGSNPAGITGGAIEPVVEKDSLENNQGFFRIVGNAIRVPFDRAKGIFGNSSNFILGFLFFLILAAVLFFIYSSKKKKAREAPISWKPIEKR